jgi:excisionase family DNA binding protein
MYPPTHVPLTAGDPRAFGLVKAAYTVHETLELLSIGRTSLYRLVAQGDLKPGKLGKKTLFYAADLAALLEKLRSAETIEAFRKRPAEPPTSRGPLGGAR